ncbi:MAG: preprotein translocase subunit SecG [Clostridia bacterium]|nr:preprotein translocase subunit SecG [Clostridia bacterium]
MGALSVVINIVLILISIGLIVAVLMQEGQRQGLGAIGGGAETFFGKNKANSVEGKLKRYTKILAAAFIVLAIVATIVTGHVSTSTTASAAVEAAEDAVEAAEEAVEAAEETAEEVVEDAEEAVEEAADQAEEVVEEAVEDAESAVEEAVEEVTEDTNN